MASFQRVRSSVTGDPAVPSLESLEPRMLLSLSPIADVTVAAGSPLYLPVTWTGTTLPQANWTLTATSSNPAIQVSSAATNPKAAITVRGRGTMVFELFEDRVPSLVERFERLVRRGFYNGLEFTSIRDGQFIRGGDPGNGTGRSNLPDIDDEFHTDLQHNRPGLLSFWHLNGDDTNNAQFLITDGPQRSRDFDNPIFGALVRGQNVLDSISSTPTTGAVPDIPQVITSARIIRDDLTQSLLIRAPEGTTGTSTITLTLRNQFNEVFTETFDVRIVEDDSNSNPFLRDLPDQRTEGGRPVVFQLSSSDVEGDGRSYLVGKAGRFRNYTLEFDRDTRLVTVTPPANFVGTLEVLVRVRQTDSASNTIDPYDTQIVRVLVAPPPDRFEHGFADNTAGRARQVTLNSPFWQHHTIHHEADHDWTRFYLPRRSEVSIVAAGTNGGDVRMLLRGPNAFAGNPGFPNGAVGTGTGPTVLSRTGFRALDPGHYFVRVDGQGEVLQHYALKVVAKPIAPVSTSVVTALHDYLRREATVSRADEDHAEPADALLEAEPILAFLG